VSGRSHLIGQNVAMVAMAMAATPITAATNALWDRIAAAAGKIAVANQLHEVVEMQI
jgi:hypothetical protein